MARRNAVTSRSARPVSTYGLTHIALSVGDVERAFGFYEAVFGMVAVFRDRSFLQAQTPGARDVIVFERGDTPPGRSAGIQHFGFRLIAPHDIESVADRIRDAGGIITEQGEFVPGEPYLFAKDLDGYLFEVWYELPTPLDPAT